MNEPREARSHLVLPQFSNWRGPTANLGGHAISYAGCEAFSQLVRNPLGAAQIRRTDWLAFPDE